MGRKKKVRISRKASKKKSNKASVKRSKRSRKPRVAPLVKSMSIPATHSSVIGWRSPQFVHRGTRGNRRGVRIVNTEMVDSVVGFSTFAGGLKQYSLNPGIAAYFPFLSTIAAAYEQYTMHQLRFWYINSTGTATPGNIILAPDYDPRDGDYANADITEQELTAFQDREIGTPWAPFSMAMDKLDMFPLGPRKYVRGQSTETTQDRRTTDVGTLLVAAYEAAADNTKFGKLFVSYDCEFFVPARDASPASPLLVGAGYVFNTVADTTTAASGVNFRLFVLAELPLVNGDQAFLPDAFGNITLSRGWYEATCVLSLSNSAGAMSRADIAGYFDGSIIAGSTQTNRPSATSYVIENTTQFIVQVVNDQSLLHFEAEGTYSAGVQSVGIGQANLVIRRLA